MILLLSFMISNLYLISSHPVMLMMLILIQATLICLISWLYLKFSWFAYILFLVFLGGLMVLFIYITSLASNELMKYDLSSFTMAAVILFMVSTLVFFNWNGCSLDLMMFNKSINYFSGMYSLPTFTLIGLTMIYLLFTLIVVVKVSNKFDAPIKNIFT
uniref:NADH-ubiquinone oxidoreductase chain 6 n=1 Tax=Cryptopygus terranovus TaxID=1906390 RepID=A0A343AYR9_9HEXA|nr:NADH dehydrogenase subunit 6 [Cryptopygus terranovus]APX54991.1 NADH dehydrogenase subunit 6 [Cryptopygus terranovus]